MCSSIVGIKLYLVTLGSFEFCNQVFVVVAVFLRYVAQLLLCVAQLLCMCSPYRKVATLQLLAGYLQLAGNHVTLMIHTFSSTPYQTGPGFT